MNDEVHTDSRNFDLIKWYDKWIKNHKGLSSWLSIPAKEPLQENDLISVRFFANLGSWGALAIPLLHPPDFYKTYKIAPHNLCN